MDRDSSVGIATCYWLDGLGFESRWGHSFRLALRHTKPPVQWVKDPMVERPGRGVGHPPPSSVEVKETVDVYLNPPLGLHDQLRA